MKLGFTETFLELLKYDKEGNLGEESVVYDFQNHVSNELTSPLNQ
jgi:hypothetical protein